jgi:hypothetical protein
MASTPWLPFLVSVRNIRKRWEQGQIEIIGALYDMKSGMVEFLD